MKCKQILIRGTKSDKCENYGKEVIFPYVRMVRFAKSNYRKAGKPRVWDYCCMLVSFIRTFAFSFSLDLSLDLLIFILFSVFIFIIFFQILDIFIFMLFSVIGLHVLGNL